VVIEVVIRFAGCLLAAGHAIEKWFANGREVQINQLEEKTLPRFLFDPVRQSCHLPPFSYSAMFQVGSGSQGGLLPDTPVL